LSDLSSIVILGTGQGGFQLAMSLRDEGFGGRIVMVGDEAFLPYQRPPLSKAFLSGGTDEEGVLLRPPGYFEEHRIELRTAARAVRIDRAARKLILGTGEELDYDHLALATGARNRRLAVEGADLAGVLQLRDLAEAIAIRGLLSALREVVVIGAGFIGLEFAATARAKGIEVTVIEAAARPMARAISQPMSEFFQIKNQAAGIGFRFGDGVRRILGEAGRAVGVETISGEIIPADLVLVGIGILPNVELAADAGLLVEDGIVADEFLATADPAVSAFGDCARAPNRYATAPIRIESVQNAVDQARCLAQRLTGNPVPYAALPWFWSDQGGLKLQIAGLTTPHDLAVARGDPAGGAFSVYCFRDGRYLGTESVNRVHDYMLARRLLAAGIALSPSQAADTGLDLKSLLT